MLIVLLQSLTLILYLYGVNISFGPITNISYGAGSIILVALLQLRKCRFLRLTTILCVIISELNRTLFTEANCIPFDSPIRNSLGFAPQSPIWDLAVCVLFLCVIDITMVYQRFIELKNNKRDK